VSVTDGNDLAAIDAALAAARAETARAVVDPGAHAYRLWLARAGQLQGARLPARRGPRAQDKQTLAWPTEPEFLIPKAALAHFRAAVGRGVKGEAAWNSSLDAYARAFPDLAKELQGRVRAELPPGWDADIRYLTPMTKALRRAKHQAR